MTVVEHSTIDDSFMVFCEVFQVLIVSRDDTEGLLLPELLEYRFGDSTANGRLCAASKLIY